MTRGALLAAAVPLALLAGGCLSEPAAYQDRPDPVVHLTADGHFVPADIPVRPGQSVTFINDAAVKHTIIPTGPYTDSFLRACNCRAPALAAAGEKLVVNVDITGGDIPLHCDLHPGMTATLMVRAVDAPETH